MLRPPAVGVASRAPLYYLLQGWAKHSQGPQAAGHASAAFDVAPFKEGVLVGQVDAAGAVLFAESGSANVTDRRSGAPLALRSGDAAVAGGEGAAKVSKRPPAGWLARIPRAFRDTLPPRAAQFKGAAPALRARAALGYPALQHWLEADVALRREFPVRFAELLADRGFREAVAAHLAQHPEWETALRPAKAGAPVRKTPDSTDPEPPR
jgi:hypothetical protein